MLLANRPRLLHQIDLKALVDRPVLPRQKPSLITNEGVNLSVRQLSDYTETSIGSREIREGKEAVRANELVLFLDFTTLKDPYRCPEAILDQIAKNLIGINAFQLKDYITTRFFNPNVMRMMSCIISSLLLSDPSLPLVEQKAFVNERIRHWIEHLVRIGAPSVFGYAFSAKLHSPDDEDSHQGINEAFDGRICRLRDYEDPNDYYDCLRQSQSRHLDKGHHLFIIKSPQFPRNNDNLLHEFIVGWYGTNRLREFIPNFTYVYGAFSCSPPFLDNKRVVTYCNNSTHPVNYIVYENIAPAVSIRQFCKTCTVSGFINVYLQVLYALRFAKGKIDFTHNDLHSENVLIRKFDRPVAIPYQTERGVEFLETDSISTFIDYGQAHIKYQGRHYGYWDLIPYSVYPRRSFIFYDAYKLLMYCLVELRASNQGVFAIVSSLVRFFDTVDSVEDILRDQQEFYYVLPLDPAVEATPFDDYLRYIRDRFETPFMTPTPQAGVAACGSLCESLEEIGEDFHIGELQMPDSYLDFYEMMVEMDGLHDVPAQNNLLLNFPAEATLPREWAIFHRIYNRISILLEIAENEVNVRPLIDLNDEQLLRQAALIRQYVVDAAEIYANLQTLRDHVAVVMYVGRTLGKNDIMEAANEMRLKEMELRGEFAPINDYVIEQIRYYRLYQEQINKIIDNSGRQPLETLALKELIQALKTYELIGM